MRQKLQWRSGRLYSPTVTIPRRDEKLTFPYTLLQVMFLEERKSTFRETALSYLSGILVRRPISPLESVETKCLCIPPFLPLNMRLTCMSLHSFPLVGGYGSMVLLGRARTTMVSRLLSDIGCPVL